MLHAATNTMRHWFWALGGDMGVDGTVPPARSPRCSSAVPKYLSWTEPVATWNVSINLSDMSVAAFTPASNNSAALYGFSVTSDATYTYLYSHCYRQFGWDPLPSSIRRCTRTTSTALRTSTSARVPRGRFEAPLEYWNGSAWVVRRRPLRCR